MQSLCNQFTNHCLLNALLKLLQFIVSYCLAKSTLNMNFNAITKLLFEYIIT